MKVTKKNIKRISNVIEKDLQRALSRFKGTNGNEFAYEIIRKEKDEYVLLQVVSTGKIYSYVTMAAISSIHEVWESSKWKDSMIYGAEIYECYDEELKRYKHYPSIELQIIADDEQRG